MDDDIQNPPSEVRGLIDEIKRGHDVVSIRYPEKRHSLFRNIGSRLATGSGSGCRSREAAGTIPVEFQSNVYVFVVRESVRYTGPDPYLDAIILLHDSKNWSVSGRSARAAGEWQIGLHHDEARVAVGKYGGDSLLSLYPVRLIGI